MRPKVGDMAAPSELQADALVQEIERRVAAQRRELLEAAAREALTIAERARDKARRQQQRALEELRQIERERTRQLRATLDTEARRQAAAQAQAMLQQAWPRLDAALARRWTDPMARTSWIDAIVARAAPQLASGGWTVRHPTDWHATDQQALQAALQRHGVAAAPALRPDASLAAGLVVEADDARLDGTPGALLADRARVEAALLSALQGAAGDAMP